jgi:hypothetical protein
MDAIVEAAMDIETAADVVAADKGGLDDGEREEGERSGEEEEGWWACCWSSRVVVEGGGEEEGGGEASDSLNWERSVGPPDGAAGRLNMSSLQTPLYRKMGGNIRVSSLWGITPVPYISQLQIQ